MTGEVFNQPPPFEGNLSSVDRALSEGVLREGAGWAAAELEDFGRKVASAEVQEWGRLANECPPLRARAGK